MRKITLPLTLLAVILFTACGTKPIELSTETTVISYHEATTTASTDEPAENTAEVTSSATEVGFEVLNTTETETAVTKEPEQTAAPVIIPLSGTYYCTGKSVNMRSKPSAQSAVLGKINYGDAVYMDGKTTYNGIDWLKFTSGNGTTVYVMASYFSTVKPVAETTANAVTTGAAETVTQTSNS